MQRHARPPWPHWRKAGAGNNPPAGKESMRARRQRNLSRHQKIFLQKRLSHKGYPLYGTEPFLDRFLSEGAPKIPRLSLRAAVWALIYSSASGPQRIPNRAAFAGATANLKLTFYLDHSAAVT